jgi:tetratricopeptide (TPR) repeat protein
MTELDLLSAVDQIVRATRKRTPPGAAPFFFIVGAGISHPPIPLAAGIEQICRKEIADQGRTPPFAAGSPLDRYQACFETAFEQADERRHFLHQLLDTARISAANFRLAHLLSEGDLTNLVFTTNFDEMLTRALRIFGHEVIVCDHPKTTQRIDPARPDLQIVHVHGTHWFYDCCNLRAEIEGQARSDLADSISMGQLLDRVLAERSPVLVGYSGWEGDVLMTAIRRRLQQPTLPFNLYWFCYRRSDLDALPSWLRGHASVRLVLPPIASVAPEGESAERVPKGGVEAPASEMVGEGSSEPTLHARDVFEAFIQRLNLKAPYLTAEPLAFFLQHLERNLDPEDASGRLYLISEVLNRVRVGTELEKSRRLGASAAQKDATEALRGVNDAVRRSAYPAAAQVAKEIDLAVLSEDQCKELDEALSAVQLALIDSEVAPANSEAELGLGVCEIWSHLADLAITSEHADRKAWSRSAAKALLGKGRWLRELGRLKAAVEPWSELVERFDGEPELDLEVLVAKARSNLGIALAEEGKPEAAIEAFSQIVERFGNSSEPDLCSAVVVALYNLGHTLKVVGKPEAALEAFSQVVQRSGDTPAPALEKAVARALFHQGSVLTTAGKPDAAIEAYSQLVERFGKASGRALRELVARALIDKGVALGQAGKPEAASEAYSQVVQRFGDASEPALRALVARALINQGLVLSEAGKPDAAIEVYSQVAQRFGDAPEPALRANVAIALFSKGVSLRDAGKPEVAIEVWSQVVKRFGDAPEPALVDLVAKARAYLGDLGWAP